MLSARGRPTSKFSKCIYGENRWDKPLSELSGVQKMNAGLPHSHPRSVQRSGDLSSRSSQRPTAWRARKPNRAAEAAGARKTCADSLPTQSGCSAALCHCTRPLPSPVHMYSLCFLWSFRSVLKYMQTCVSVSYNGSWYVITCFSVRGVGPRACYKFTRCLRRESIFCI